MEHPDEFGPSTDPGLVDAVGQARLVRDGAITPLELVDGAIARIEAMNPTLNAVIDERFEAARAEAAADLPDGPFRGVPILLKDLNAQMAGERCFMGTRFLRAADHRAAEDAYLVARLRAAGFVVLGRTNTPELGSSPTTEPLSFGPTRNPWDLDRSPGGSSGGSAAAVAAGMVAVAHASDGGGSIRIPASCCGLFGLKPSRGRISRGPQAGEGWGGASTDGCLTRTVRDAAAMLDVLAGAEPGDPYVAPPPERTFASHVGGDVPRWRVGVLDHPPGSHPGAARDPEAAAAAAKAADLLSDLGHDIVEAHPAALDEADFSAHYAPLIAVSTAQAIDAWSAELGRTLGPDDVEPQNLLFAQWGRSLPATQYLADLAWLHTWSRRLARFWTPTSRGGEGFDLLVTPTLSRPPVRLGELVPDPTDPASAMVEVGNWVAFTTQFNVSGQPAMSLPVHWTDGGLPVGAQVVGPAFGEGQLLALAAQLEAATGWADRRPPDVRAAASP
jgi:amidase